MDEKDLVREPKAPIDLRSWATLFQPDILASSRYYERILRTRQPDPERMLMFAVLEDAISSYQKGLPATDSNEKACYREARDWLLQEKSDWPFSFDKICEALDLDPNYLRKGLFCRRHNAMNRPVRTRLFHIVRAGRRARKRYQLRSKKNVKPMREGENGNRWPHFGG